jgi:hypothetical protein
MAPLMSSIYFSGKRACNKATVCQGQVCSSVKPLPTPAVEEPPKNTIRMALGGLVRVSSGLEMKPNRLMDYSSPNWPGRP